MRNLALMSVPLADGSKTGFALGFVNPMHVSAVLPNTGEGGKPDRSLMVLTGCAESPLLINLPPLTLVRELLDYPDPPGDCSINR